MILHLADRRQLELVQGIIGEPYARMVRSGQIAGIELFFQAEDESWRPGLD
jgi:hypothetical protein